MALDKLQIEITHEQQVEILIEFPISILSVYNGSSELDVTWDDNIMYLIHESLASNGVLVKNTNLDILSETRSHEEKLSYQLFLIVTPPIFDFNWIIEYLLKENFQKGLCIKMKELNNYQTVYFDEFCADYNTSVAIEKQTK